MRKIALITGSRADFGIYRSLLRGIQEDPDLDLHLIVAGMHLSPEFGLTVNQIAEEGIEVKDRIEMLLSSDSPEGIAKSMGLGVIGFAQCFSRVQPDILVLLGDRFEMCAAALAALPFKTPLAHIHGGEVTEGAIDDAMRHSITKMSHLHFVTTEQYGHRVLQMGEEPWRITVSGAPGLDDIHSIKLYESKEFKECFGFDLDPAPLLVTFHPTTLEYEKAEWQMGQLLTALNKVDIPVIFTMPNGDTNGRKMLYLIQKYTLTHPSAFVVDTLGTRGYFTLMSRAAAMVGNSSSGLIEAPSFKLPVVNIGSRQKGRDRTRNVIDVDYDQGAILKGIEKALDPAFKTSMENLSNPYVRDRRAAEIIVERIKDVSLNNRLVIKRFYDLPGLRAGEVR